LRIALQNYLIDSYLLHAASVLAANSVLRSLFGVAFPLFVSNMYANLGEFGYFKNTRCHFCSQRFSCRGELGQYVGRILGFGLCPDAFVRITGMFCFFLNTRADYGRHILRTAVFSSNTGMRSA
jgi:hypothetical protein